MSQIDYARCRISFRSKWQRAEELGLEHGRTYLIRLRGDNLGEGRPTAKAIYDVFDDSFKVNGVRFLTHHYEALKIGLLFSKEGPRLD